MERDAIPMISHVLDSYVAVHTHIYISYTLFSVAFSVFMKLISKVTETAFMACVLRNEGFWRERVELHSSTSTNVTTVRYGAQVRMHTVRLKMRDQIRIKNIRRPLFAWKGEKEKKLIRSFFFIMKIFSAFTCRCTTVVHVCVRAI